MYTAGRKSVSEILNLFPTVRINNKQTKIVIAQYIILDLWILFALPLNSLLFGLMGIELSLPIAYPLFLNRQLLMHSYIRQR